MSDKSVRCALLFSLCLLGGLAGCTSRSSGVDLEPAERLNKDPGTLASFTFPYYTTVRSLKGGGALAVWMRREGQFRSMVYRRATDATAGFGDEGYLSPEDLRETISVVPTLLNGPDPGELYAIWQARHPTSGNKLVVFRRSTDAGARWGGALTLNSEPTAFIPAMAGDSSGGIYAAWTDERRHGVAVYFNRSLDHGQTWLQADVRVDGADDNPGSAVSVDVATDGDGSVVIVWEGQAPPRGRRIFAVGSRDRGSSWSTPVVIGDDTDRFGASAPRVVFVGGRAVVVWTTAASGVVSRVWSDSSADGGVTWGQDVLLHEQKGGVPSRVHLAADGTIARVVLHGGPQRGNWNVYYAETDRDGTWNPQGRSLSRVSPGDGKFSNPRLAVSADGELYVTYQDERKMILLNRSRDGGQTWDAQAQVLHEVPPGAGKDTGKATVQYPQIAVADGVAYVTWEAWTDPGGSPKRLSEANERVVPGDLFVRRVRYRR